MEPNATSLVIKALKDMRCLCLCPSHGAAHGTSWNCSRKKGASPRPTLAQHGIILRRVDAEHVVSKGKKTKNIKHSGNLTKNVFLDLLTTTVLQDISACEFRLGRQAIHYQAFLGGHLPPDALQELGKGVQGHGKGACWPSMFVSLPKQRSRAGKCCGARQEILGTCFAVGCTVDGQKPIALQEAML